MMFGYINSPRCSNGPPQFRLFWESELCQSLGKVAKCLLCFLSPKHKERGRAKEREVCKAFSWSGWCSVHGALDLYCHCSSTEVPADSCLSCAPEGWKAVVCVWSVGFGWNCVWYTQGSKAPLCERSHKQASWSHSQCPPAKGWNRLGE